MHLTRARFVTPTTDPKPCPRCYAAMRLMAGVWCCPKHGAPKEKAA